jgi:hypothetical protein
LARFLPSGHGGRSHDSAIKAGCAPSLEKGKKVVYYRASMPYSSEGGHSEKLIVFCSNANYSEAVRMIMNISFYRGKPDQ